MAGLLVRALGRIPERGDQTEVPLVVVSHDDNGDPVQEYAELRVVRMDGLRVDRLTIRRVDKPSVPTEAGEQA